MKKVQVLLLVAATLCACVSPPSTGPQSEKSVVEKSAGTSLAGSAEKPATTAELSAAELRPAEAHDTLETRRAPSLSDEKIRRTVARALPFLEEEGLAWMAGRVAVQDGRGCVSCHHVPFALWSHEEAKRVGFELSSEMAELSREAVDFVSTEEAGREMNLAPMLLAGAGPTEVLGDWLAKQQLGNGKWRARGQFPSQHRPIEESDRVAAHWSMLALQRDAASDHGAAIDRTLQTEKDLSPGESVEWLVTSLLTAHLVESSMTDSGEASGELDRRRRRLLEAQNPDGSWSWKPGEDGNVYSTGQALYALALMPGEDSTPIRRAQAYLTERQLDDGTWQVPSVLFSEEHGEANDVIYRYWGTAWAVIGLARSL